MARWRVIAPHYIYAEQWGQPTEWAREETNRESGRTFRKTMKVPMLVDPNDPACIGRQSGMCIVARRGSEQPGDIVFEGPPTPDLEPLDDEAMAQSDAERHKWVSPIDSLPLNTGEELATQLIRAFESQIGAVQREAPQSLKGVASDDLAALKAMIATQQEQIAKLMSAPVVIDTAEPLEDIDPDASPVPPPPVIKPTPNLRRNA